VTKNKHLISGHSLAQRLDDPALRIVDATVLGSYDGDTGEYNFQDGEQLTLSLGAVLAEPLPQASPQS
jgi:hypothetical protein